MRPAQRAKKAEEAANKLSSLVCSPQVTQLLQQPLPPQPTAAQIAVLDSCSSSLFKLCNTLPDELPNTDAGRAAAVQLLRGVLRHHPVHSAGVLMVWLQQQQPQQLAAMLQVSYGSVVQLNATEGVWRAGMQVLSGLVELLYICTRGGSCMAAVAELIATLTQQLLQSGGCVCC